MGKQEFEIKVSRKLIRYFREWLANWECECEPEYSGHYCGRCAMLGRIDADMATIGENNNG